MVWSNLSLTESKYKIRIFRSKVRQLCLLLELIVAALCWSYLLAQTPLIFNVISTFLLIALLVYFQRKSSRVNSLTFEINKLGHCQWQDLTQSELTTKSKVAWWGCYLYFKPLSAEHSSQLTDINDQHSRGSHCANKPVKLNRVESLCVLKDSISARDYARLCRIIYCVKQAEQLSQ